MQLSVMMPCYQEAENLKEIIPKIDKTLTEIGLEAEMLVIDTMTSMDNTEDICRINQGISNSRIRYLKREGGNNYGDAIRTGISRAEGEYLVIMDADGSHSPEDIKRLYEHIIVNSCVVVIGSRYMSGGNTDNSWILKLMSHTLNIAYRFIFHLDVKDVSDSYRIYDLEKLKRLSFECDNFDIVEEILIKIRKEYPKDKIEEIPIYFSKRKYGESKRDLIRFVFSYISTIRRLQRITRGCKV